MSLSILYSRARSGISAPLVTVEVHLSNGLPVFSIVVLPEAGVRESRERVRGAIINSNFEFPSRRITVNLAPADLPKDGGRFDLPIALGVLAASNQIPENALHEYEWVGELALGGQIRDIRGILPVALATRDAARTLVTAMGNATEAARVEGLAALGATDLLSVCAHLCEKQSLTLAIGTYPDPCTANELDLADISGQAHAKRALEIAACGGHHLLFSGPPGTGKTMLASRLPSLLPTPTARESLDIACIHSLGGLETSAQDWGQRPFRNPHHTASAAALVGGGNPPLPGEVSRAHHGILFLDELPEFKRHVLEVLREPLESGQVTISRAGNQAAFPARFQLIAAMNPCPCGYLGDPHTACQCTPEQRQRYRARLSGPFLDRIDMHAEVARQRFSFTQSNQSAESSHSVRQRVIEARQRQLDRQQMLNSHLPAKTTETLCHPDTPGQAMLEQAIERFGLSIRALHRILKVARTIADLEPSDNVKSVHVAEALGYRH